ncbi:MAG TPA: DNA-processing protein DprA [Candidatus Saccharimonadales bacterium]|nr:DNA-processing protein DprA [Candidatus Saccharimonadales bacterium]
MHEDLYWLGFSAFSGVGPLRFQKLLTAFGSAKAAWDTSEKDLTIVLGAALTAKFIIFRETFSLEAYAKKLSDKKISFLFQKDTNYPQLLLEMSNAPFVLYCKGDVNLVSTLEKSMAVVGTRKITHYGEEVTKLLTKQLVEQDFVIVSGLALGVDAIAHQVTMDNDGKTIAVLGCGVDCCNPSINQAIYDKIIRNFGAVVSESAFGNSVSKGMFPARNRIIAGLSMGVLVTEGSEDSGALITAQRALEIHRPVFAVPGPITSSLSQGPLHLIQQGAHIVQSADDILRMLQIDIRKVGQPAVKKIMSDIPEEQQIIALLEHEGLHVDDIVRSTGKSSEVIGSTLSMMEIKGLVVNRGGKFSL